MVGTRELLLALAADKGRAGTVLRTFDLTPDVTSFPLRRLVADGAADAAVLVQDARTGAWVEAAAHTLEIGDTYLDDGRLVRVTAETYRLSEARYLKGIDSYLGVLVAAKYARELNNIPREVMPLGEAKKLTTRSMEALTSGRPTRARAVRTFSRAVPRSIPV